MMKRTAITQSNTHHCALCFFCGFTDSFRHFFGLACSETNPASAVTDDYQCGKTETATTFNHFGNTVDTNQLFNQFRLFALHVLISFVI